MKQQADIKVNFIMNCFLTLSSFLFPLIAATITRTSRIKFLNGNAKKAFAASIGNNAPLSPSSCAFALEKTYQPPNK